jgi:TPP-dependent pyruvate/acetoin dehydrogenase alpha subunit
MAKKTASSKKAAKPAKAKASKKASATKPKLDKEVYVKWYEDMLIMRKLEEKQANFTFNKSLVVFVTYTLVKKQL